MSGPIRNQVVARRDRLESHSPMHRSRNSSPPPSSHNESPNIVAGTPQQVVESTSVAADSSWSFVAMQITAPSRPPSPGPPVRSPSVFLTPPAVLGGSVSRMTINDHSNHNSLNNSPGCTIVNNNNSFTQVFSRDPTAEDLNTIEKGLGQLHVSRGVHDAQPPTAGCIEGTRVQLLESTQNLLAFPGGAHIVWIAGMAGTGKTSIALTLCRLLVKIPEVLLGGSFFCSRSAGMIDRTDAQRIIPTLATILARQVPAYAQALAVELKKDPDIASKAVTVQVERLLLKPLKSVRTRDRQIVLVVDALDEYRDQSRLAELINALADFEITPLNNPDNHERLFRAIDALNVFKTTQLDDQARLAELIEAFMHFKKTPPNNKDQARLFQLIDGFVNFKATPLGNQANLAELIGAMANLKTMPLDDLGTQARLLKLIDALAKFRATQLDDQAGLRGCIDAVTNFKTTPLDNCDNQARLEELIGKLVDLNRTPLKSSGNQVRLVKLIDALADLRSTPPIKFLLTSRPEMHIRGTLITDTSLSSIVQLHMVDEEVVTSDIQMYIRKTLEESSKSLRWYTDPDIDDLATLSAGLFIFASTVLAYILRRQDAPGRLQRLRTVKQQTLASTIATDPLDRMYLLVLMQASDPHAYEATELDETRRIVAVILSTRTPLTIRALAGLLGVSPQHLRGALDELHAVILVPEQDDDGELRTLHASFGDFIFTRAPEHIRIDRDLGHRELARACLQRMAADDLCFNISRSRSSYESNSRLKPDWIARSLIYACLHWAYHITFASEESEFDVRIFSLKFLFWLEVLSVRGEVHRALEILDLAAKKATSPSFTRFLRDANSFVISSREAIERSAPHIYLSAMAFAPKHSFVYQTLCSHLTGVSKIETFEAGTILYDSTSRGWSADVKSSPSPSVDWHTDVVHTVAISRDGCLVASAFPNGSVRVWNSQTCQQTCPPLLGHEGRVHAVAFSSDGRWVATGSLDTTVRLWDAQTGRSAMPELRGHTYSVSAVVFSPDDFYLASGSLDATIRVWKVITGQPAEVPRIQCSGPVLCLAYSPNGELIAVGGGYNIVRIFNAVTGQEIRICRGDTAGEISGKFHYVRQSITSLAFSSDGARIVALACSAVVVFDVHMGHQVMKSQGHSGKVDVVAYSPDGQFTALGSKDGVIRLWSPVTNQYLEPELYGHVDAVSSVAVSSDGRLLVTSGRDQTIRIWDLEKIRLLADERSHSPLAPLALAQYEKGARDAQLSGWLVSPSGELLLWVPLQYRGHLDIGGYTRVIGAYRAVITAEEDVLHQGEQWTQCWRGPVS